MNIIVVKLNSSVHLPSILLFLESHHYYNVDYGRNVIKVYSYISSEGSTFLSLITKHFAISVRSLSTNAGKTSRYFYRKFSIKKLFFHSVTLCAPYDY